MKTCPSCGTENEDSARTCTAPGCGHEFEAPRLDTLALPQISFDVRGAEAAGRDPPPRFEAPPRRAEAPPRPERPQPRAEEKADAATKLDSDLKRFEESGKLTVGIIGFATSGKTFFLNRLKNHVLRAGYYDAVEAFMEDGAVVEGNRDIETHDFIPRGTAARRPRNGFEGELQEFHVIDIPGEQFRQAVDSALQGPEAETLLRVLKLSHALIIVLPANEVFARHATPEESIRLVELYEVLAPLKDRVNLTVQEQALKDETLAAIAKLGHAEAQRKLDNFLTMVSTLAAHASEIEGSENARKSVADYLQSSVIELAGLKRGAAPPVYIALAKADLVIKPGLKGYRHVKNPMLLDSDPSVAFRIHREELYNRISECFTWYKFDFVTCFQDQPANDMRIRYARPHYGIGEVVEWINWASYHSVETGRRRPLGRLPITRGDAKRILHALMVAAAFYLMNFDWPWVAGAGLVAALVLFAVKSRIGLVRWLGRLREEAASSDPGKVGLEDKSAAAAAEESGHGVEGFIARRIEKSLGSSRKKKKLLSGLLPVAYAAVLGLLAVVSFILLTGSFRTVEPSAEGYAFPTRPVYDAEIRRMERDDTNFKLGFPLLEAAKWEWLPDNGGWFNFWPESAGRRHLRPAMEMLPERAAIGSLSRATAEQVRAGLTEAANGDSSESRGAVNYHRALTSLLEGQYPSAAEAFRQAATEVEAKLSAPAPGANATARNSYARTTNRLLAAQISIQYGLGLAEFGRENWAQAAEAFQRAWDIARREKRNPGIVDPGTNTAFWYVVTTREAPVPGTARPPQPMLHLPTADIWTNLLAALIRQHSAGIAAGDHTQAEQVKARLAALATEAAGYADQAARYPRLAANLMIAAARSGARGQAANGQDGEPVSLMTHFPVSETDSPDIAAAARYGALVAQAQGDGRAAYWRTVRDWRAALDSGQGAEAVALVDQRLAESGEDADALRSWLCDVMETEFGNSSAAAQREITRNYGTYFCGGEWWRYRDAASPFGFWRGILLWMLLIYASVAIFFGWRRVKSDYRHLFNAKHHLDRLGIR